MYINLILRQSSSRTHTHTHTNILTPTHTCTLPPHTHTHTHTLHEMETLKLNNYTPRTVQIYTDSRIKLSSLKNTKNRKHLIEEISKKTTALENENWHTQSTWIKAHAGHRGNELADKLAKEAAKNMEICFNKIPKSEIVHLESQKSITNWQQQWDDSSKGRVTKEFFPDVKERLKRKINLTPNFTTMVTGHGMTKAYLHRFKITQSPECVCAISDKTVDHLIFDCPKLEKEREKLIAFT